MVNEELLYDAISANGLKLGFIANKLDIDRSTLWRKVKNQTEFTASEISMLSKLLGLNTADKDRIFFN